MEVRLSNKNCICQMKSEKQIGKFYQDHQSDKNIEFFA